MASHPRWGSEWSPWFPCGSTAAPTVDPVDASNQKAWTSGRIGLVKNERKVTLDYIAMDCRMVFLKSHAPELSWLKKSAGNPTLLKAASHLLPKPYFSACRAPSLTRPLLIQTKRG